jgi:hypothetical protein
MVEASIKVVVHSLVETIKDERRQPTKYAHIRQRQPDGFVYFGIDGRKIFRIVTGPSPSRQPAVEYGSTLMFR